MNGKTLSRIVALAFVGSGLLLGCAQQPQARSVGTCNTEDCSVKLLVFSKTTGYRHESIKDGIAALKQLGEQHHVLFDFTEDATKFNAENLKQYKAVIFLLTSGDLLNEEQQAAFEGYIRGGGGYVGLHSASDSEYNWPWYGKLVGAYFSQHGDITQATIIVNDRTHPSTLMLPERWQRTDEWYNFATDPSKQVHVLMQMDESSYKGGTMGESHPIAWYHQYDGGRAWYSALGHTSASYQEPLFLAHLWGGIEYAAGLK